jgi:AGZA family xanthine/uracil permease-like MFS transporter
MTKIPDSIFSAPDFTSTFFQLDIWGALKIAFIPAIFTFVFIDLFDSLSTFMGVSHANGLLTQKGEPRNLKQGLIVDAIATAGAGLVGTSSGTAFIESSAGIQAGGRTGWSAVITAICFIPCLFLGPLAGMVPVFATAPVLMFVGLLMFKNISEIRFGRLEEIVPAFLTLTMIPLTFSITHGISWGILSHLL